MSLVLYSIPISILLVTAVTFLSNYYILSSKYSDGEPTYYLFFIAIAYIVYTLYSYGIALLSSKNQCDRVNWTYSILLAHKPILFITIAFVLISYFETVRSPFRELFGKNVKGDTIAQIYFIALILIITTIVVYFDSAKHNCKLSRQEVQQNIKKLDEYLNKPYEEKVTTKVTVKD